MRAYRDADLLGLLPRTLLMFVILDLCGQNGSIICGNVLANSNKLSLIVTFISLCVFADILRRRRQGLRRSVVRSARAETVVKHSAVRRS